MKSKFRSKILNKLKSGSILYAFLKINENKLNQINFILQSHTIVKIN